jgi:hypothetical protein
VTESANPTIRKTDNWRPKASGFAIGGPNYNKGSKPTEKI